MAAKSTLLNMVLCLGVTCLLCSAILGVAYAVTEAPIREAAAAKTARSIGEVLPSFTSVEEITESFDQIGEVTYFKAMADDKVIGYAIRSTAVGFGGPLTLLVGVTADGVVYNTSVLSHSETPGLGAKCTSDKKFMEQWKGLDPSVAELSVKKGGSIDAITASTITSRAYTKAVAGAIEAFRAISGTSSVLGPAVDIDISGIDLSGIITDDDAVVPAIILQ